MNDKQKETLHELIHLFELHKGEQITLNRGQAKGVLWMLKVLLDLVNRFDGNWGGAK